MAKKIRIVSKKAGFRRAGIAHPDTATLYDPAAFTPEQLKELKAEPMLVVDEVDVDAKLEGKSK